MTNTDYDCIDPILFEKIKEKSNGHIIPKKFNVHNKTVPVERDVDNYFGKTCNFEIYNYVNRMSGVYSKIKIKTMDGYYFSGRAKYKKGEPLEIYICANGDNEYISKIIHRAIMNETKINISFNYSELMAKLSLIHTAYLYLWSNFSKNTKNYYIRRLLKRHYYDCLNYNDCNFIENMVRIVEIDKSFKMNDIICFKKEDSIFLMIPCNDSTAGIVILPSYKFNDDNIKNCHLNSKTIDAFTITNDIENRKISFRSKFKEVFWLSKKNKIHNYKCNFYKKCKGKAIFTKPDYRSCKICMPST